MVETYNDQEDEYGEGMTDTKSCNFGIDNE